MGYSRQVKTYQWQKKHHPTCPTQVNENLFSHVLHDIAEWTPLNYFKQIWKDEIANVLVKQTNIENSEVDIYTHKDEIEKLVAVQMLISTIRDASE